MDMSRYEYKITSISISYSHPTSSHPVPPYPIPALRVVPCAPPRSNHAEKSYQRSGEKPHASDAWHSKHVQTPKEVDEVEVHWCIVFFFCWEVNITGLVWGKIYLKPWLFHGFPMIFLGGSCTFSLEPIQVIQEEAFQTLEVDSWSALLSFLAENAPQFLAFDLDILDVKHSCLPFGYD